MALAHVTLATRDVRATSRFFAATLGWLPIDRPSNITAPAAWLAIAPGQELHLIEVYDFTPSAFEREYGRHVAVTYPRDHFPALKQRLVEEGAEILPPERDTQFERFFFRDPNGYLFEVVDEGHGPEGS
jgi:catechol 2,3-dioxygenase-like lactoylglutathione lyase family enzyme